eukprot:TRINITY_DN12142_c0_g1_i1.p1 TRINITY_DN12142_c0_g1~~TRINITY_DN12142_c0_g1_i1.p1  ORF type:complete len:360 (+),score=45.63 TRINITY_DN12142_c0_g1_i1:97-1080(+)
MTDIRAWRKEWNVMKKHSNEFCGSRRGSDAAAQSEMVVSPIQYNARNDLPPGRFRPQPTVGGAHKRWLQTCREMKKVSDESFERLGNSFKPPEVFVPYAVCLAVCISYDNEHTRDSAWHVVKGMLNPPSKLMSAILQFDIMAITPGVEQALLSLPLLDPEALEIASPAALAIANWCHCLKDYFTHLCNSGERPVAAGVSNLVKKEKRPQTPSRRRSSSKSSRKVPLTSPPLVVGPSEEIASGIDRWISVLGLHDYRDVLVANEVDEQTLPLLTARDLSDMGIPSLVRQRVLTALPDLRSTVRHSRFETPPPPVSSLHSATPLYSLVS